MPAKRVLYVEDNRVNAILFEEAMRLLFGAEVELRVAEDGAEGLAIAAEWPPDVLALDAHLPDIDGFALLERLRALPGLARARAFMCSAEASDEHRQRARAAGFDGYWAKPIDFREVNEDLGKA